MRNETLQRYVAAALSVVLVLGSIPVRAIADAAADDPEQVPVEEVVSSEDEGAAVEDADIFDEAPAVTDEADEAAIVDEATDDVATGATVEDDVEADPQDLSESSAVADEATTAAVPVKLGAAPKLSAAGPAEIDSVSITVTPPEAGTHSTNAGEAISTSTPGLSVAHASWKTFKGYSTDDPAELDFVEGNSYYVVVCLDVADGYTLKKGAGKPSLDIDACDYAFGGDTSVSGGTLDSAALRSTERYGSEKLYIWAKATATAGSAQTVGMRVWTEGHGKILVNGTDYGTEFQGTWYEGTKVQAEAVPDEGYKLERWWIQKSPGPNARRYDTAITLVAGTDLVAEALFALETASVTITPPAAGTTAATAPQITLPDGAGYSLDTLPWGGQAAYWTTEDNLLTSYPEALDESTVFEPGQTYYAYVRLAEDGDFIAARAGGSSFDTDLEVSGGTKTAQGNFAAWSEEHGNYMGIMAIIAVTIPEAITHAVTFDTGGHFAAPESQDAEDGGYATEPTAPSWRQHTPATDGSGLYFHAWYIAPPDDTFTYTDLNYPRANGGKIFDFNAEAITADTTVYAGWDAVLETRGYDVTNRALYQGGQTRVGSVYYDGSSYTYGVGNNTAIAGTEATVYAKPDDGYTFVGWSTTTSKDDIVDTATEYTFTVTSKASYYALFEKETPSYDLTFEFQNMGTSASLADLVSSITVNGEEWPLPASGMKVTKPVPVGASVTAVVEAADGAAFFGASSEYIPDFEWQPSDDQSTFTFTFTMPESGAIGLTPKVKVLASKVFVITYDANGGTTGPAWQDAYTLPDFMAEIMTSLDVSDADLVDEYSGEVIVEPPAGASFAGLEITDKNGVHTGAPGETITGLDFSEGATIKYLWEMPPTLTLHWSSVDGEDLMEPIEIEYTPGMTLDDALRAAGYSGESLFAKDGYLDAGYKTLKPVNDFEDEDDFYVGCISNSYELNDETDIYVVMFKELDAAEATVEAPVCGSTEAPVVSLEGDGYDLDVNGDPRWVKDTDTLEPYEGELVGGNEYLAYFRLAADFRYYFADDAQITVNGEEPESAVITPDDRVGIIAKVAVEHDPGDPVVENRVEPTCTEAGSYDEVIYCKGCGEELSRETKTISALGHDWGDWEVVTEATEEAEGLERRTCKRCGEVEERAIPQLVVEYTCVAGDGQTHVIGSGEALTFTFERSVNDAVAFDHFTGVQVDGRTLSAKAYTAEAGSVVVTLNADYLDTLAAGKHTLTALFDDGNGEASASFSVEEKQEPAPEPKPEPAKKDEAKPAAKGGLPKTGDTFALVGLTSLTLALVGFAVALAGRRIRE